MNDHRGVGPSQDATARSGRFVVTQQHPPLARAVAREQSGLALLAEIARLLQEDDRPEPTLLEDLARRLGDAGLETVIDVQNGSERTRYGAIARAARLDAIVDTFVQRSMTERRPMWCVREPVSRPCGVDDRVKDDGLLRELTAVGLDWVLAVPMTRKEQRIGALTVYAPADASTFPSVALVSGIAELAGAAIAQRRDRRATQRVLASQESAMATVAHDLKNALSVVATTTRLVRTGQVAVDDAWTGVAAIERQVTRMLLLVHDLLESDAMRATEFALMRSPCPPSELLGEAVSFVSPLAAPKRIRLSVSPCDWAPPVLVDARRIDQVLVNLVSNAVKFTPAGGKVTAGCVAHADGAAFYVADSGPGIEPEHVPHLFERFWHGTSPASGAGLGLAIARTIVEAHGGRIWVESEPGRGAKFVFTVPFAPRPHE
jgi:signal transduction histidine kinase